MKLKISSLLLIIFLAVSLSSCKDEPGEDYMDWELVSVSDPDDFKVEIRNRTAADFPNSSAIYVMANYREGDVVLRCVNHDINDKLVGSDDSYTNREMGFTLTTIGGNTLRIHFDQNASGEHEMSDQITLTNANGDEVCNTFLFIDRTFGEISQTD